MEKKKVVVTGLGCITPLGNDVKTFWEGIRAGRCGIKTIERFDASRLNVKVAGEVRDFDVGQYIDPKEAKRVARFAQYSGAPATQAWVGAGDPAHPPAAAAAISSMTSPAAPGPVGAPVVGAVTAVKVTYAVAVQIHVSPTPGFTVIGPFHR